MFLCHLPCMYKWNYVYLLLLRELIYVRYIDLYVFLRGGGKVLSKTYTKICYFHVLAIFT